MALFSKLFGQKNKPPADQAVLVKLDAVNLPQEVYETNDLASLEDELISALEGSGLGEFDGNEVGNESVILYLYGPDAEKLYGRIEVALKENPLCQHAKVIIRKGGPGAEQREVTI